MITLKAISGFFLASNGDPRAPKAQTIDEGQRGFTLVEMLVVITIIGLIMGLIGPRVLNYLSESKVKAARIQLQSFGSALDLFYLDAGRFPSTAEGLARVGEADPGRRRLERSISARRQRSRRSLEPSVPVSLSRRARSL